MIAQNASLEEIRATVADNAMDVNAFDEDGDASIHVAAATGRLDVVRFLVERANADVNLKTQKHHRTPLYQASIYGHRDVCLYLISWCSCGLS